MLVRRFGALTPMVPVALALLTVAIGLQFGARAVGGSDSSGYVSQAELWATGRLRIEQPIFHELDSISMRQALVPLGWTRSPDHPDAIVPSYPAGLPLTMAVFQRAGGRDAVFYVVPLLGGLAVWATYLMGVRFAGRSVGLAAAVLLASSPAFLFQLMFPMSDVPVTAWWALSLALLDVKRRDAALVSGLATGLAILTRPNLGPVAAVPALFLVWQAVRERRLLGPSVQRMLLFAAGSIPACLAVVAINRLWYGSSVSSAYGPLQALYSWRYLRPNVVRFSGWLLQSQSPLIFAAAVAPFLLRRNVTSQDVRGGSRPLTVVFFGVIAVVFASYFFHVPFDTWWYLRYLLPAYPPILVLAAFVLITAAARLVPTRRHIVTAVIVGAVVYHGIAFSRTKTVFVIRQGQSNFLAVARYVAERLPSNAVLISWQHSGSLTYYTGRPIQRYDVLLPEVLDNGIAELLQLGYHPYLVLTPFERSDFGERFRDASPLASLDWMPMARDRISGVEVFDPLERGAPPPRRAPEEIR